MPVGSILPNDAEMMDRCGVSRTVLREAMMQAGFEPYPQEWWHFSYPVPTGAERLDFALAPVRHEQQLVHAAVVNGSQLWTHPFA